MQIYDTYCPIILRQKQKNRNRGFSCYLVCLFDLLGLFWENVFLGSFYQFLVYQEVVDRTGCLGALTKPVRNALGSEFYGTGFRVI